METTEMTDTLKSINTTPHLCRSKVKQTALEIASAIRPANKFSRVGMSFVDRIEAKVRIAIREEVRIHPSKGDMTDMKPGIHERKWEKSGR